MTRTGYCALTVVGWFVLAGCAPILRGQDKVGVYTIEYQTKTNSLIVEAVEELSAATKAPAGVLHVKAKLRNVSTSATITAFAVVLAPPAVYYVDFATATSGSMRPGQAYEQIMTYQPGQSRERVIRVLAVLFDNGVAPDGDLAEIENIRYQRSGEITESTRFLAVLKGVEPSRTDDAAVEALEASVSEAPASLDGTLLGLTEASGSTEKAHQPRVQLSGASPNAIHAFMVGVGLRRSEFQNMVQRLRQLPSAPQQASGKDRSSYLSAVRARYEQRIAALQSVCARDPGGIQ